MADLDDKALSEIEARLATVKAFRESNAALLLLTVDIPALINELREARAQRDEATKGMFSAIEASNQENRRAIAAEARIAAVRAVHGPSGHDDGFCLCDQELPCPTIRALDGDGAR